MSAIVPESKRLLQLEKLIRAGQKTFVEVGTALAEIRDAKLYKLEHDTFEDYCREKWGWKRDYCDKLIQSANTVKSLPKNLHTIVGTETQARELAKAPAESRTAILEKVAAAGKVTAKAIQEAVEEDRPRVETLDEKWGKALGKVQPVEPQLSAAQSAILDLDSLCDAAHGQLLADTEKAEFKARLLYWAEQF